MASFQTRCWAIRQLYRLGLESNWHFDFISDGERVLVCDGIREARIAMIDYFHGMVGLDVNADADDDVDHGFPVSVCDCFSLKRERFLHRSIFKPMRRLWTYFKWKHSLHTQVSRLCRRWCRGQLLLDWCRARSLKQLAY